MKHWNYRILQIKDKEQNIFLYQIHEVYYSKKGKIKAWTKESIAPYGESKKELKQEIKYFKDAFKFPILKEKKQGKKIILVEV